MKRSFLRNRRAASNGVVFALISIMITILVGVLVVNSIISSVTPDTTWSADANTTWANTQTNIWLGFGLVVIIIIVIAAYGILQAMGGSTKLNV